MISDGIFKRGFRRLASGVSCITTRWQDQPLGFLATSVSALSVAPPTLIVCVNRDVSSHDSLHQAGILCVNVLGQNEKQVAALFSDKDKRDMRFADLNWQTLKTGAPALSTSLVAFDCEIDTSIPYATHTIFVCRIVDAFINEDPVVSPLLYFEGGYRELSGFAT